LPIHGDRDVQYVLRTMRVSVVCLMCDAGVSFVWRECVLCVMRVCVVCYVSAYFCVYLYIFAGHAALFVVFSFYVVPHRSAYSAAVS
jgi:hypothetical protein